MKKNDLITITIIIGIGLFTACSNSKPDTETISNLKASLNSENYTSARYNAFSDKAIKEGYMQIGKLFKALSIAESVHAKNFKNVLDSIGVKIEKTNPNYVVESTEKNLQNAIKEEIMDIDSIYPNYIKQSNNSSIKQANHTFTQVWEAEKTHKNMLVMIYDKLMTEELKINNVTVASAPSNKNISNIEELFSKTDYYVCPVDGCISDSTGLMEKCSVCETPKNNNITIN